MEKRASASRTPTTAKSRPASGNVPPVVRTTWDSWNWVTAACAGVGQRSRSEVGADSNVCVAMVPVDCDALKHVGVGDPVRCE
jgi:hypothetical protein